MRVRALPSIVAPSCAFGGREEAEWMHLGLTREAQRRSCVEESQRRVLYHLHVHHPGAVNCIELVFEIPSRFRRLAKEVAIHALEVAVDVFHGSDRFQSIDRRNVTLRSAPSAFLPMHLSDVGGAII